MTTSADCSHNTDPLKLVREGTSQAQRLTNALDPKYAPVDDRTTAHGMVFARTYSAFLKYFDAADQPEDNWEPFFSSDPLVQLADAAVEDVAHYRQQIKEYAAFLNDRGNQHNVAGLRQHVDYLFSALATLVIGLDHLTQHLPDEFPLKKAIHLLVRGQLAPQLRRLIGYRKGGETFSDSERPFNDALNEKRPEKLRILGRSAVRWSQIETAKLSKAWMTADGNHVDWRVYYAGVDPDDTVFGAGPAVFERVNHLATHTLFTSILDQFLKVYARVVGDAGRALGEPTSRSNRHEPHYALFMAFLRLLDHARTEANRLSQKHLDFYYHRILKLKEKAAQPGQVHLLVELAKQAAAHELRAGELFKAGKDQRKRDAFFANDRAVVMNQAKVVALKTLYRHGTEKVGEGENAEHHKGRLYASPVSNSQDGRGGPLTTADQSWHPFHNKIYTSGKLSEIRMPHAEVGFAIASHYLWMAEGTRIITVNFATSGASADIDVGEDDLVCSFTSEKGWSEVNEPRLSSEEGGGLHLEVSLSGLDPAITPYDPKTHGYDFGTDLPILLVKLRHRDEADYVYSPLRDVIINGITLTVEVKGLKTLAVSNDFGPVDTSKPFQPFGALPMAGSSLIVGSKELFQKLAAASLHVAWAATPTPFSPADPKITVDVLKDGRWIESLPDPIDIGAPGLTINLSTDELQVVDAPDFQPNEPYGTASRYGFVKLKLTGDFGQDAYQAALVEYIIRLSKLFLPDVDHPGNPPVAPSVSELSVDYTATQTLTLDSAKMDTDTLSRGQFFHLSPFGQAEQHPALIDGQHVWLLPQFDHEAEIFIGVTGLKPPQTLTLLFQVADGTADPLSQKPVPHLHWSYLRANEWVALAKTDVDDQTGGLLNSGIVTLSVPRDATDSNTFLPNGMHWIRAAVASESDAVCRLILVAAQALKATFADKSNDPEFPGTVLAAGTISKLDEPHAAVKAVVQPFATFGGRGAETSKAFYIRASERLRHKDRAIALWDYERLILEAFPEIYRVKCLNHTQYEPTQTGAGIYREMAPGHVTIVTVPDQQFQHSRDPLRPYTSLGLLEELNHFVSKRLSCFVQLHVRNPEFEEVSVSCHVRLREGFEETFYTKKLQDAITRFLSPWAFPGGGSPSFGGKIYKSALINFVEEQPYVDYVTDLAVYHTFVDSSGFEKTFEGNVAQGSNAISILVSVPAMQHKVTIIKAVAEAPATEKCPCEA